MVILRPVRAQLEARFGRSGAGTLLVVNEEWLRDQEDVSVEELMLHEQSSRSKSQVRESRLVLRLPQLSAQTVLSPLVERQWTIVAESSLDADAGGAIPPTPLNRRMPLMQSCRSSSSDTFNYARRDNRQEQTATNLAWRLPHLS